MDYFTDDNGTVLIRWKDKFSLPEIWNGGGWERDIYGLIDPYLVNSCTEENAQKFMTGGPK